jgi:hypothetical protein
MMAIEVECMLQLNSIKAQASLYGKKVPAVGLPLCLLANQQHCRRFNCCRLVHRVLAFP